MTDRLSLNIAVALSRLVTATYARESVVVSLPIMYPSGAFVGVSISLLSRDNCFLSDTAIGLREAEMAGASNFYDAAAKQAAEQFGVEFDGASVFAASSCWRGDGCRQCLGGSMGRASLKAAEYKERSRNKTVFDIVSDIFGLPNVLPVRRD